MKLQSGHWLNKGMEIETQIIDIERSARVVITGFELVPQKNGGRSAEIRYALQFMFEEEELGSRPLITDEVSKWLSDDKSVVREAFEWLKMQDGVSSEFMGFAAEYERAFEYGQQRAAKRALPAKRI